MLREKERNIAMICRKDMAVSQDDMWLIVSPITVVSASSQCFSFNLLMPGANKKARILKQTCSFQLQVCLSMCDLFVTTRHQRVKHKYFAVPNLAATPIKSTCIKKMM